MIKHCITLLRQCDRTLHINTDFNSLLVCLYFKLLKMWKSVFLLFIRWGWYIICSHIGLYLVYTVVSYRYCSVSNINLILLACLGPTSPHVTDLYIRMKNTATITYYYPQLCNTTISFNPTGFDSYQKFLISFLISLLAGM